MSVFVNVLELVAYLKIVIFNSKPKRTIAMHYLLLKNIKIIDINQFSFKSMADKNNFHNESLTLLNSETFNTTKTITAEYTLNHVGFLLLLHQQLTLFSL